MLLPQTNLGLLLSIVTIRATGDECQEEALLSRVMKTETQIPDVSGKLDKDHRFCGYESVAQPLVLCFACKKKTSMCSNIQL